MVSTEDIYTPVKSSGCLWIVTKIVVTLLVFLIFFLGLFAGIVTIQLDKAGKRESPKKPKPVHGEQSGDAYAQWPGKNVPGKRA